jgi:hypothetical protein
LHVRPVQEKHVNRRNCLWEGPLVESRDFSHIAYDATADSASEYVRGGQCANVAGDINVGFQCWCCVVCSLGKVEDGVDRSMANDLVCECPGLCGDTLAERARMLD